MNWMKSTSDFDRDVPTFIIVVEKPPAVGPGATAIHSRHGSFTPRERYLRVIHRVAKMSNINACTMPQHAPLHHNEPMISSITSGLIYSKRSS